MVAAFRSAACLVLALAAAHAADAPLSIADIVEQSAPSVAVINTNIGSVGAGFVAFDQRSVITNLHVVAGSSSVTIKVIEGAQGAAKTWRELPAKVVAVDGANDLALLSLTTALTARPLALVSAPPRVGETVLAIGNPGMGSTVLDHTVSNGIVSAAERKIEDRTFLQTTAAINPGNSGGPLLDLQGRVVGVVTAKAARGENIGFVVPASLVQAFWNGREGAFRVAGDLAAWERANAMAPAMAAAAPAANGIPINAEVVDLCYDAKRKRLFAVGNDSNRFYAIDPEARKVVGEVVVGSAPMQFLAQPGAFTGWVICKNSKSAVNINLDTMKQVKQVPLSVAPIAFTLAGSNLWVVDNTGGVTLVRQTGGKERKLPIEVRSIAYYPKRKSMLVGAADSWLWEIDEDRLLRAFDKLASLDERAEKAKDQRAYDALVKEAKQAEKQIDASLTKLCQPAGTRTDFAKSRQGLLVDATKGRIIFNRTVVDYQKPEVILGVLQQGEAVNDPGVRKLLERFPWFDQVRAVSPDGTLAASGMHIYRVSDFTVLCELPALSTAVAFSPDGSTLWYADVANRQIGSFPVPKDPAAP